MKPLADFRDIHTHNASAPDDAILSVDAIDVAEAPQRPFSVGLHPWSSNRPHADVMAAMERVERMAASPLCMAIGETGMDKRRGASPELQMALLRRHAALSERFGKPLILHVVGFFNEIMQLHRELRPRQLWIVHGFRGKPQLAAQLVRAGIALSFGEARNPASFLATPESLRYSETD